MTMMLRLSPTAAIAEIAHCYDHLDVDGFVLLTNVGDLTVSGNEVSDNDIGLWATTAPGARLVTNANRMTISAA